MQSYIITRLTKNINCVGNQLKLISNRDANLSTILGVRLQTLPAMCTRLKCSSRIFGSEDQKKRKRSLHAHVTFK